jgi:transposase-like protein
MPDPDIVLDAYRQVGGTTALARHFGVPRHTASSWLRRLRTMGHLDS